ncbi:hypothetical protein [Brassicibacter mesophilus]|uniref:hypothetical protein n=1 Tax=Brassicibacter mesophilus TaxID=745119 RepID=UPI003D1A7651
MSILENKKFIKKLNKIDQGIDFEKILNSIIERVGLEEQEVESFNFDIQYPMEDELGFMFVYNVNIVFKSGIEVVEGIDYEVPMVVYENYEFRSLKIINRSIQREQSDERLTHLKYIRGNFEKLYRIYEDFRDEVNDILFEKLEKLYKEFGVDIDKKICN